MASGLHSSDSSCRIMRRIEEGSSSCHEASSLAEMGEHTLPATQRTRPSRVKLSSKALRCGASRQDHRKRLCSQTWVRHKRLDLFPQLLQCYPPIESAKQRLPWRRETAHLQIDWRRQCAVAVAAPGTAASQASHTANRAMIGAKSIRFAMLEMLVAEIFAVPTLLIEAA